MEILKVKENGNGGYIVNDNMTVPNADGNRHYRMIREWIANGGVVEHFETQEEKNKHKEQDLEDLEWKDYISMEEKSKREVWKLSGKPKYKA